MYFLGVDIGSATCDAVLIDAAGGILSSSVVPTGARSLDAVERAKREVIDAAGIAEDRICGLVSTGYGRERVGGRVAAVTEIRCHALGIHQALKDARLLIDIGGQDSKVIRVDPSGRVVDFVMNDRCAAGTGYFLESMAGALQVDVQTLSTLDRGAGRNLTLSSVCAVFAKSEVVSLVADGVAVNEIVHGLNRSIAVRISSLVKRVCSEPERTVIAMSGGVANNEGVVRAVSQALGGKVHVPRHPDIIGALGAAMIARGIGGNGG
ncbi:MAG: acyl-CoA dehydratase activase [bacterium]